MKRLLPLLLVIAGCDDDAEPRDVVLAPVDARVVLDAAVPDAAPDARVIVQPDVGAPDAAPDLDAEAIEDAGGEADLGPDFGPAPDLGVDPLCVVDPVPPRQPPLDMAAGCRQGGPLRIKDVRDPRCPDHLELPDVAPGPEVEIVEAVVTGVFDTDFAVQDADGGPYSGLWVFNRRRLPLDELRPGTRVRLRGQVIEFFTLTEMIIESPDGIEVIGQGEPPEPVFVADGARVADEGDLTEILESMLIEVPTVKVLNTAPDCPRDFGMVIVSGGLRLELRSGGPFDYAPSRGDVLTRAAGVLTYSFDHNKVLVRGDGDLTSIHCGGVPDKCDATECRVTEDAEETGVVVISEIQNNPIGDDRLREFVELYNPGEAPVDLDDWLLQDCAENSTRLAGTLEPGGFLVVAGSLVPGENGGVRADALMGDFFLPNGFGSVLLFDARNVLVDQVRYAPGGDDWPDRRPGESLELLDPGADNREGGAWRRADGRYGDGGEGSPGRPTE